MHQRNKMWAGGVLLFSAILLGLSLGAQKTGLPSDKDGTYIEVHGPNIPVVPQTAKYVKYDGKIKRVVKFTETLSAGDEDCQCPKCCKGECYVIIYTDLILPGGPLRILYILWVAC